MKTAEWFASLSYGSIDFLIPQSSILESNFSRSSSEESLLLNFSMDRMVKELFSAEIQSENNTRLLIKSHFPYELVTSAVPVVCAVEYSELRIMHGAVGEYLRDNGIIAFRSQTGKLQYVIDPDTLKERWLHNDGQQED